MKLHYEDLRISLGRASFLAYRFTTPQLGFHLHYHPEYELTLLANGQGMRMVGDRLSDFHDGDLVLLGPNLPHTWVGTDACFEAVVVQFPQQLVDSIAHWPEFETLGYLLQRAGQGLVFDKNPTLMELIKTLAQLQGSEALAAFLRVLDLLGRSPSQALAHKAPKYTRPLTEQRLNEVFAFLEKHHPSPIRLSEVAKLVHLSESAFCKFFKKNTQLTFSAYLNKLRIDAACKALKHGSESVASIAFACGFENLSYFNRVFRTECGVSPRAYRRAYHEVLTALDKEQSPSL